MVSYQDAQDFKTFCRQATDRQIWEIYGKERDAFNATKDDARQEYAQIAWSEIERRGLA